MNQEQNSSLLKHYKLLRCLYFGYLVAAVLALVLYFVDKRGTLILLGASLIYHLAVVRPRAKAYQKEYVHTCVELTLGRYLKDAVHSAKPVLAAEEVRAARLVAANNTKGSILCCEGGQGTYRGQPVTLGDVTFTHSFPMEGKTHHEFATGMWMTVELGYDTGLDWRLISRRVMMTASRDKFFRENPDLQLLRDPGADWLEDYLVVLRQGAPSQPCEGFLTQARKLAEYTPGAMAVCIQGSRIHVFLTNRIFGRKVSIREEPVEERVRFDLLPELGYVLKLADLLYPVHQ